jgi:signal transduction histidine kinase
MPTPGDELSMERAKTDESLQSERKKTDSAVELSGPGLADDALLEARRDATDEKRRESRREIDESRRELTLAKASTEITQALRDERAEADRTLLLEREESDDALHAAEAREHEFKRILAEEREKTDKDLGSERDRTDVVVDAHLTARGTAEKTAVAGQELLAEVGHDLRNALQTIQINAASLALRRGGDTRAIGDCGEAIQKAVARATGILEDLAPRDSTSDRADCADSRGSVSDAVEGLLLVAEKKSIRLVAEFVGESAAVQCDASSIDRVLSNLIGNAIKFTPAGGEVTVRAERTADTVRFQVADTGIGILPEHMGRIFERGFRGNTASHDGLGLGLAIAKELVEARGGTIGVESRVGGGAIFFFSLATLL